MQKFNHSKKAGTSISLKFLMGLLGSVFLILFFIGIVLKFTGFMDKHYEEDVIDQWANEIKELNQRPEKYLTQLLPINEDLDGNYLIFIFQIGSNKTLGYSDITKQNLYKPTKCNEISCICAFYTKSNKFTYCKTLGVSAISLFKTPYNSEDFYVFGNKHTQINAKPGQRSIIYSDNVYIIREDNKIQFCLNATQQTCT